MNARDEQQQVELIAPERLFRGRDDGPIRRDRPGTSDASEESEDTSRLPAMEADQAEADSDPDPKITRLPEGIEVIEQSVGRAIGNWILQVRCQCGRRWFETTPVDATHCPRCGMYVYIDMQPGPGPQRP